MFYKQFKNPSLRSSLSQSGSELSLGEKSQRGSMSTVASLMDEFAEIKLLQEDQMFLIDAVSFEESDFEESVMLQSLRGRSQELIELVTRIEDLEYKANRLDKKCEKLRKMILKLARQLVKR